MTKSNGPLRPQFCSERELMAKLARFSATWSDCGASRAPAKLRLRRLLQAIRSWTFLGHRPATPSSLSFS
ncbi:unnamed protein product, partial [Nesidiocoris tenuis]